MALVTTLLLLLLCTTTALAQRGDSHYSNRHANERHPPVNHHYSNHRHPHDYRPGLHSFVSHLDNHRFSPARHRNSVPARLASLPPALQVDPSTNHYNNPSAHSAQSASTAHAQSLAFALKADKALAEKAISDATTQNLGRGPGFQLKAFEKLHSYYGALEIYTVASPASGPEGAAASAGATAQQYHPAESRVVPNSNLRALLGQGNTTVPGTGIAIPNPAELLTSINWTSSIVAIVLIVMGVLMAFAGFVLFKVILFIAGFYSFSLLTVSILNLVASNLQPAQLATFTSNSVLIYGISLVIMGILGGALFLCLWKLGLFAIGGLLGYTLATFILTLAGPNFITAQIWRVVFTIAVAIVFAVAILFIEKPLLIVSTAVSGSFALTFGIDVFAQTGFVGAVVGVAKGVESGGVSAIGGAFSGNTLVMSVVFVVVAVVGLGVQWLVSSREKYNGRLSHASYNRAAGMGYKKAVPVADKA